MNQTVLSRSTYKTLSKPAMSLSYKRQILESFGKRHHHTVPTFSFNQGIGGIKPPAHEYPKLKGSGITDHHHLISSHKNNSSITRLIPVVNLSSSFYSNRSFTTTARVRQNDKPESIAAASENRSQVSSKKPGLYYRAKQKLGRAFRVTLFIAAFGGFLTILFKDDIEALDRLQPPRHLSLTERAFCHDRKNQKGQSDDSGPDDETSIPLEYKGIPLINYVSKDESKPRLVILGTGWGSVSMLKTIDPESYDICVVSPTNYFLFTPLLPSATVGTVELRSLLEPVRKILKRVRGIYIEGAGEDVDFEKRYLLVKQNSGEMAWLPYDKLIIGVGAASIGHGVPGLEYCHQLKTLADVRKIRHIMMKNFEQASLPSTSPEEKKRLLSFIVCGGGPTGCEFAAELYDFLYEDLTHYFPKEICDLVNVTVIQSRDHILNMFDKKISEFAESEFKRHKINVVTNARVAKINEKSIVYSLKNSRESGAGVTEVEIPQGFVLWSTGVGMTPFTQKITEKLPEQQHKRCIAVDPYLRVKGVDDNSAFALGDCASVEYPHLIDHIMEFVHEMSHEKSGEINFEEFKEGLKKIAKRYPAAASHLHEAHYLFEKYDVDKSGTIDIEEFRIMLHDIDKKLTTLPALAQVASQEGKYLGQLFNTAWKIRNDPRFIGDEEAIQKEYIKSIPQFNYNHLGSLTYLGNAAAADFGGGRALMGSNLVAKYLWRSAYWSEQVSMRTRILLMMDWTKELLFGRDTSYF